MDADRDHYLERGGPQFFRWWMASHEGPLLKEPEQLVVVSQSKNLRLTAHLNVHP